MKFKYNLPGLGWEYLRNKSKYMGRYKIKGKCNGRSIRSGTCLVICDTRNSRCIYVKYVIFDKPHGSVRWIRYESDEYSLPNPCEDPGLLVGLDRIITDIPGIIIDNKLAESGLEVTSLAITTAESERLGTGRSTDKLLRNYYSRGGKICYTKSVNKRYVKRK